MGVVWPKDMAVRARKEVVVVRSVDVVSMRG
jgi:hypothetical protein